MSNIAVVGGTKHPPLHAGDSTSAWFTLQYVRHYLMQHNLNPDLSPHTIVKLVASIGAETHGKYTYQAVVSDTQAYSDHRVLPQVGLDWTNHVNEVILAGIHHHRKGWVKGFAYTPKDEPNAAGKTTAEKIADGPVGNAAVAVGDGLKHAVTSLIPNFSKDILLIGVILLVVVLVARK